MTIDVQSATKTQLIDYAKNDLGLELPTTMKLEDLRAAVADAMGVDLQEPPKAVKVAPTAERTYTINIAKTEGATGGDDVFVGVNGVGYLLRRGIDIPDVPASVIEVLRNAKEMRYEQRRNPQTGQREMLTREVQAYPFSVVA